jgi:hypothetical protein
VKKIDNTAVNLKYMAEHYDVNGEQQSMQYTSHW